MSTSNLVGGVSGLPAAVTRGFAKAWRYRCRTHAAARARARLKKAAHRAERRNSNGDFRRATDWQVI